MRCHGLSPLLALLVTIPGTSAEPAPKKTPKEALRAFNDLIGTWRGTGEPAPGIREDKGDFWSETIAWEWQFKGDDVFLKAAFDKSKHFTSGELRYVPDKDNYRLTLKTTGNETLTFDGAFANKRLVLDRSDEKKNETQRLTFSLLHEDRHLYRYEVKPGGRTRFATIFQVGATKEGAGFARPDGRPECVVSGGLGTMTLSYKGKTYYFCCTGCRDAFNENPEKFIAEFKAKKAGKK